MSEHVIGFKELESRLGDIAGVDLYQAIRQGVMLIEQVARAGAPVHDGQLRNSITSWAERDGDHIRGTCSANTAYAMYVELGTGPQGAANHDGISPNINPAYTMEPWWIHEGDGPNEINRQTAETYHFPYIDTDKGRFYKCSGQPANPFMYRAYKDCEDEVVKLVEEKAKEHIGQ